MQYTNDTSSTKFLIHASHVLNYMENSPEVMNALARYGYDVQQFSIGRQLLEQARNSFSEMESVGLRLKATTEQFQGEWKKLKQLQQVHLQAARRCLTDELAHLLGRLPTSYTSWAVETDRFYSTVLNNQEYQAKLNSMSIPSDELVRAQQWVYTLMRIKDQQNQMQTSMRLTQQQKEIKQNEFKQWYSELLAIVRIALRNQPTILQMLRPLANRSKPSDPKVVPTLPLAVAADPTQSLLAAQYGD